jgi:hypothetical protein
VLPGLSKFSAEQLLLMAQSDAHSRKLKAKTLFNFRFTLYTVEAA